MIKKPITLIKAVDLKKKLELARNEVNEEIKALMEKPSIDTDKVIELENKYDDIVDLILDLHIKIQEANLKIGKKEEHPNSWFVKYLSELTIRKSSRDSIDVKDKESNKRLKETVKAIEEERMNTSHKLTAFNTTQKVKIIIPDSLIQIRDNNTFVVGVFID